MQEREFSARWVWRKERCDDPVDMSAYFMGSVLDGFDAYKGRIKGCKVQLGLANCPFPIAQRRASAVYNLLETMFKGLKAQFDFVSYTYTENAWMSGDSEIVVSLKLRG